MTNATFAARLAASRTSKVTDSTVHPKRGTHASPSEISQATDSMTWSRLRISIPDTEMQFLLMTENPYHEPKAAGSARCLQRGGCYTMTEKVRFQTSSDSSKIKQRLWPGFRVPKVVCSARAMLNTPPKIVIHGLSYISV